MSNDMSPPDPTHHEWMIPYTVLWEISGEGWPDHLSDRLVSSDVQLPEDVNPREWADLEIEEMERYGDMTVRCRRIRQKTGFGLRRAGNRPQFCSSIAFDSLRFPAMFLV